MFMFVQKSSVIQVLQSIELDTAPEFFTEIILTDVLTNFDNIEHSVNHSSFVVLRLV